MMGEGRELHVVVLLVAMVAEEKSCGGGRVRGER